MIKFYGIFHSLLTTVCLYVLVSLGSALRESEDNLEKPLRSSWDWHLFSSEDFATMFSSVVSGISAIVMMVGGAVPYIPQYRSIRQNQNAEGFSTFVCLALLTANILRIMFWFGKPFELPLLIQSFIMIATMLLILRLVVTVRQRTGAAGSTRKHFREMNVKDFWQWTDFQSYVEFLACFTTFCVVLYLLFGSSFLFIETIGFLAVFTEAMLGVPQFYRNFQNKSTAGMSVAMVAMWTSGDVFKTVYFIARAAPIQFVICGILQVCIDIAILLQVLVYGSSGSNRSFREIQKSRSYNC